MQVVGVSGPADEVDAAADRLVAALSDRGEAALVADSPDGSGDDDRTSRADVVYRRSGGEWAARGEDVPLDRLLDRLAADYDYAVVAGFPDATLPRVAVGERDPDDGALATAPSADAVDVEDVCDAVDDLQPRESLTSLVARAKRSPRADRAGAIATFTGRVRTRDDPNDAATERLEFEKYEGVADRRTETIREEIEGRDGVFEVLLHHRTGVVEAGEDIVFVVVLAGHRREAFAAVEDGIDRLKEEVPLFKKEVTVDDAFWSHDRP